MKTIQFIQFGKISAFPPFMAILDSLIETGEYKINILSSVFDDEMDKRYESSNVHITHLYDYKLSSNSLFRKFQILKYYILFYFAVKKTLAEKQYDIVWVIHEITAIKITRLLKMPYIVSVYELNDKNPSVFKKMRGVCKKAKVVIACEYNRAHFMKSMYDLKDLPVVLPNKPYHHPRTKNIQSGTVVDSIKEKIVLYQGQMYANERNLAPLCEAVSALDGYKLVLMGNYNSYVESLIKKYPHVSYISFIKPPHHLDVTSHAYIGFVSYDSNALNTMYCAPNKIWEYSGFGIPMLGNEIPGLKYTVEFNRAGICTDTNDKEALVRAIRYIDEHYKEYSENAKQMYETCNVSKIINDTIKRFNG